MDSGNDGAEVLDALDESRLIISGNSCSLARWDVKLGFQPQAFVAGLSKLSSDGGVIVLMDVIIEKVYPLAFMPAEKGDREPPWNEAEERSREDKWKVSLSCGHPYISHPVRIGTPASRPGCKTW